LKQNGPPSAEERICWIRCPANRVGNICWCFTHTLRCFPIFIIFLLVLTSCWGVILWFCYNLWFWAFENFQNQRTPSPGIKFKSFFFSNQWFQVFEFFQRRGRFPQMINKELMIQGRFCNWFIEFSSTIGHGSIYPILTYPLPTSYFFGEESITLVKPVVASYLNFRSPISLVIRQVINNLPASYCFLIIN
jgi:hypothetical protein